MNSTLPTRRKKRVARLLLPRSTVQELGDHGLSSLMRRRTMTLTLRFGLIGYIRRLLISTYRTVN